MVCNTPEESFVWTVMVCVPGVRVLAGLKFQIPFWSVLTVPWTIWSEWIIILTLWFGSPVPLNNGCWSVNPWSFCGVSIFNVPEDVLEKEGKLSEVWEVEVVGDWLLLKS